MPETKLIFIDCETGGLDPEKNPVLQIAGEVVWTGHGGEKFNLRARPFSGQVASREALEVTGLTVEQIKDFPEPEQTFGDLLNLLARYVDPHDKRDKLHFVAYNAPFDAGFVRKFFENNGDKWFGSWFWHPPIDVMTLAAHALIKRRSELPNFKLKTVCEFIGFGRRFEDKWHDAQTDIEATKMLYEWIIGTEGKPQ